MKILIQIPQKKYVITNWEYSSICKSDRELLIKAIKDYINDWLKYDKRNLIMTEWKITGYNEFTVSEIRA